MKNKIKKPKPLKGIFIKIEGPISNKKLQEYSDLGAAGFIFVNKKVG